MVKKFLIALAAALPLIGQAAWLDAQGKRLPDTPSMKASGDFAVQLVLTPDEKAFREAWNAATNEPPRLVTTDKASVGATLGGMLIFTGCAPGPARNCDVTAEFTLQQPNGTRIPAGRGPVWLAQAPQPRIFLLGQVNVAIAMNKEDPPGTYQLQATVTDNVAKRTLQLTTTFELAK